MCVLYKLDSILKLRYAYYYKIKESFYVNIVGVWTVRGHGTSLSCNGIIVGLRMTAPTLVQLHIFSHSHIVRNFKYILMLNVDVCEHPWAGRVTKHDSIPDSPIDFSYFAYCRPFIYLTPAIYSNPP